MIKQNYEKINAEIKRRFLEFKESNPEKMKKKLNISWSNWGFGIEDLDKSLRRLNRAGLQYVELHGNHYGEKLGYNFGDTFELLKKHDMKVSGVCGMFSKENDLSSSSPLSQQNALEYIEREIKFTSEMGGHYLLVVPGAVGRPIPYDDSELFRSSTNLRKVGDMFLKNNIKAAIEPVRSDEVSFIHSVKEAQKYIEAVNHKGVKHINGDLYHMQVSETHIGEAILQAENQLINLHLADSNRQALGSGSLDLDTVIMSLYLIGHNEPGKFVTPEPLGAGSNPYSARNSYNDSEKLDDLVFSSVEYFKERENLLINM